MSEYTEDGKVFIKAVDHYLDGLHAATGAYKDCPECLDPEGLSENEYHDLANEPSFSWRQCDSCGSKLGGDRYPAHAWPEEESSLKVSETNIIHLDICSDCLLYLANGDVPEVWE